ncbi:MAG TPA: hypothetical protein VMA30_09040 [Xanthobacteraceae bacterium]|nr:hypothetical protein [Xanthobacteraceae bacterium]
MSSDEQGPKSKPDFLILTEDNLKNLTEDDLEDALILTAGVPGSFPNQITVPTEKINQSTALGPLDIVIFFEKRSPNPVDETGCNQWAFVVDDKTALYVRGRVRSISIAKIRSLPNATVIRRVPAPLAPYVASMLLKYRWRPSMFQVAVNFLQSNNYRPFLEGSFFPPDVSYASDEEYEVAWQKMVAALQPGDCIFTFDRASWMSKLIARATHGPFSHCGIYIGGGELGEVVTSGTRIAPIETYKGRKYRVAVYRHYGTIKSVDDMISDIRATAGRPGYGYIGALRAGVIALFGAHHKTAAPNSLILWGFLTYITQA